MPEKYSKQNGYANKKEKDCDIWITISKIQTLAIENVRTKKV